MNIKSLSWLLVAMLFLGSVAVAQEEDKKDKEEKEGYVFTEVISIPNTSVKNQYRSGTCWSFSGIAFVEAELLRLTNKEYDLSEMFAVYHTYSDRAKKYVRMHGKLNFGGGAEVTDVFKKSTTKRTNDRQFDHVLDVTEGLDPVVINDCSKVVELVLSCEHHRFPSRTLIAVTVAHEAEDPMRCSDMFGRQGHPRRHRQTVTQRTGREFHSGNVVTDVAG